MTGCVLVIAPHPDDEILGVGGTIARFLREGREVHVAIVTRGYPPDFDDDFAMLVQGEAREVHAELGTTELHFIDLPAAALDTVPHREVNAQIADVLARVKPDTLFIPFSGDLHLDHWLTFLSGLVVSRPNHPRAPKAVYAYETLSETNWGAPYLMPAFVPNVYVDISGHLEAKVQAMKSYRSQVKPFPNERSLESIRALAALRGSTVGYTAAEAFVLIRQLL